MRRACAVSRGLSGYRSDAARPDVGAKLCCKRIPYGDGGLLPAPLLESAGHQVDGRNIVAG